MKGSPKEYLISLFGKPMRRTTRRLVSVIVLSVAVIAPLAWGQQSAAHDTMVDVGGYKLHARTVGSARTGAPTLVFELGWGSTIDNWGDLATSISTVTRAVFYERAGIGASEAGKSPPTVERCATDLHALLAKLDVRPPVVLVGHSWGGPIIHTFGAMFPKEIAGLVYIDPVDFTQTEADMQAIWRKAGLTNGHDIFGTLGRDLPRGTAAALIDEAREIGRVDAGGFADLRKDGDPPDVPTLILLAGKEELDAGFPAGNRQVYSAARLAQRVEHFGQLAARLTNGTVILSSKSGHFVHLFEPLLVEQGLERIVSEATLRPELDRFVGNYRLTTTIGIGIFRDRDVISLQITGQQPIRLTAVSATTFSIPVVKAEVNFELDAAGKTTALVLIQNGTRNRAIKEK
jgi:pimeloyl-ACP methyl ester carboxylesterase